jgi:hypothetical protein
MKALYDENVSIVQDKIEKHKYYIILEGHVIGVQYNIG